VCDGEGWASYTSKVLIVRLRRARGFWEVRPSKDVYKGCQSKGTEENKASQGVLGLRGWRVDELDTPLPYTEIIKPAAKPAWHVSLARNATCSPVACFLYEADIGWY